MLFRESLHGTLLLLLLAFPGTTNSLCRIADVDEQVVVPGGFNIGLEAAAAAAGSTTVLEFSSTV